MSKSIKSKDPKILLSASPIGFQIRPETLAFIIAFARADLTEQDYVDIDAFINAAMDHTLANPTGAMLHRILSNRQDVVQLSHPMDQRGSVSAIDKTSIPVKEEKS